MSVDYKKTLNLPHTEFPIRADHKLDDPIILARWAQENLAAQSFTHNQGQEKFILHDGPPYANGHIHLGHAYNKILKDILTKAQRMSGKHVPITPGWDCHGLPIEIKVAEQTPGLEPIALRKACREYAQGWVDIQRDEFKKLGVLMDWDHPYLTMDYKYEADILRAFGKFVAQGYIERKNKTVAWCPACQTTLASAEIEYQDRKDPSVYVLFSLNPAELKTAWPELPELANKPVSLLVWTTTPWTLPLNRAVFLKPKTKYQVLYDNTTDQYFIVGVQLADQICATKQIEKQVITEFDSEKLLNSKVQHPFIADLQVPILLDPFVSVTDGTACVHSAPGCGPEDYEMGRRYNLEIFSPISADGKYTAEIEPKELLGMPVTDGQIWVIKKLAELNKLFYKSSIKHSYPHCWRCRGGLIFRATSQWFCDLSHEDLQIQARKALDQVTFVPERAGNNLKATIDNRLEWCLSRQRVWGVPIPALLCQDCDQAYLTPELIEIVATGVENSGVEYWDKIKISELLSEITTTSEFDSSNKNSLACANCKSTNLRKEQDILDVWFDSGVSHYAVLKQNPELAFPADVYLEGRDQARGWFQSSLLTSLVVEAGQGNTNSIVTHGYTVDAQGRKMSKSLGNVVAPQDMIKDLGTDGLRLWVAATDLGNEVVVSPDLLNNVKEVHRKIRNTARFLLSNLYDFNPQFNCVRLPKMSAIDIFALYQLGKLSRSVQIAYREARFTAVFHELAEYCTKDLSAFYLDIIKDRLYCEQPDGLVRQSAQTVSWIVLDTLTKLMAPILSFTAEQISDHAQTDKPRSIHLQDFTNLDFLLELNLDLAAWDKVLQLRSAILRAIESQRETGVIKHSLEAAVEIDFTAPVGQEYLSALETILNSSNKQTIAEFLQEFMIVSKVQLLENATNLPDSQLTGIKIGVSQAVGNKCPRCWKYELNSHVDGLCARCQKVVNFIETSNPKFKS